MQTTTRFTLVCVLIGLVYGAGKAAADNVSINKSERWLQVADVFDGETVRLLGIDCPEPAKRNKPGEPLAAKAKAALLALIGGQRVRLKTDVEKRDRYDRLLAQIYLEDGAWINGELVRQGWAHVYTFPPNMRWADNLLELERRARGAKRGIWSKQRFQVLAASNVENRHIGQFRVIEGLARHVRQNDFAFQLSGLEVSVPRKYQRYFDALPHLQPGTRVLVRGTLRKYGEQIRLALHSPADLEILSP